MRTVSIRGISQEFLDQPERIRNSVRLQFLVYKGFLVITDLFMLFLAFRVSYYVRFFSGIPYFRDSIIPQIPLYSDVMLAAILFWAVIFALVGLYKDQNLLGGTREYSLLFNAITLGAFLIISVDFFFPDDLAIARGWVFLAWITALVFLSIGRFILRRAVYAFRVHGHFQNHAVVVGINAEGKTLVDQILNWRTSGLQIVGYVDQTCHQPLDKHIRCLGKIEDLDEAITKYGISEIILTNSALSQEEILGLFRKYGTAKDINLRMSSGLYEIITTGMQVREDGLVPLVTINKVRMTGIDQVLKLLMDYLIAFPTVILLAPVYALIALAVRLDSPGPAIYRRRVMGINGRQFDAFKFRTMRINGDEIFNADPELLKEYQENFKLKNDPRITRLGNLLRKTSLDEIPQLFNVLLNEMSLVGPRMICPEELPKYDRWDINLLTVKPGITGLWQVQGRSNVSYEERVKMDMFYIRTWTIWLDLKLLLQTVPAVLARRGAF
jgi:exopolysaccharide biosynthesis polyprenyl glycosylphosphotransferase